MKTEDLYTQGPITIVAFGDSVTHGCLQAGVKNYESVYWNRLRKKPASPGSSDCMFWAE